MTDARHRENQTQRPLLVYGGTFDPPQLAHVRVARSVAELLDADLIVVPTAQNPLKSTRPTDAAHRLAMTRLAFAADSPSDRRIEVSTLEIDRAAPSFTVDTLESIRRRVGPQRTLRLLMGSDAALGFARWHEPERILVLATPAVVLRPPDERAAFLGRLRQTLGESLGESVARRCAEWIVDAPAIDVAATEVRRRIAAGEPTDELLDPAVARYVDRHRLYQA